MSEELSNLPPQSYFDERDALALLVPRANLLAALADAYAPAGAAVPVDIAINHHSEDLPMHSVLPAAPTAVATWPQGEYPHLPQSVGDVTDFGDGKVDIDWGHPAPVGGTRLYSADQMRAYVDADRAVRAGQPATVAGSAVEREAFEIWARSKTDWNPNLERKGDGYAGGFAQTAWEAWRGRQAAPALEAPAAPAVEALRALMSLVRREAPHLSGKVMGEADAILARAALAAAPQAPAAPSIPQWIDDPHDIEQGQMLNPAWVQAQAAPAAPVLQLPAARAGRIYVAGPMTGLPDHNFPAFNAAAAALRANGWHVENPAEHGIVEGAEWADYLHYDMGRLATCSAVHLLPGWSKSRGAALEVHVATTLGMPIFYADGAEPVGAAPAAPAVDASDAELLDFLQKTATAVEVLVQDEGEPPRFLVSRAISKDVRSAIKMARGKARAAQAKEGGAA